MGDQPKWRAARDGTWQLLTDAGQVVGELTWVQDAHERERTGWWLRLPGQSDSRRLNIDPVTDQLAADRTSPACSWLARAEAVSALTLSVALTLAESKLGDDRAVPPNAAFGTSGHRYEIYLHGPGAETVGLAFPQLAAEQVGALVIVSGRFDDVELCHVLRRLRRLGCTVAGFVTVE
jgi:hypothetical protein